MKKYLKQNYLPLTYLPAIFAQKNIGSMGDQE